jgi:pimeloyl-ACP methyl ester carboxylesterase
MFRLYRFGAHAALRASGARGFRFRVEGADLKVWTLGRPGGEPWMLLHGLGAMAAGWLPLARHLARDCRMVLPELSALGGSRVDGGGLAICDGMRAVAALAEQQFPGQRVTFAGNSLGGWLALRMALDRPDLVERLVLVAPGGFRDQDWERIEHLIRVEDTAGAARVVSAMFLHPPLPRPLMARAFRAAFTSPAVRGPLDKLCEADALSADDLARIEVPVALIWGESDGVFDVSIAEKMAAVMPNARLFRIPAAHVVQWDRPGHLVAAVEDFCASTRTHPENDPRSAP